MRKIIILLVLLSLPLFACSKSDAQITDSEIESPFESSVENEQEKSTLNITSYPAEMPDGVVFHWALFQNGRDQVHTEDNIIALNARLNELNVQGKLQIHVVDVTEGLVTPDILQETEKLLGHSMDFISISPKLIAFYKEDWGNLFVDMEDSLKDGKLKTLYESAPQGMWELNRIAGGIYSFSNTKLVGNLAYMCIESLFKEVSDDVLMPLVGSGGFTPENEHLWQELMEYSEGYPVIFWVYNDRNYPYSEPERIYEREPAANHSNVLYRLHFKPLTPDIQYNFETEQYEWIGDSEAFSKLREEAIDYYEKGYLGLSLANSFDGTIAYTRFLDPQTIYKNQEEVAKIVPLGTDIKVYERDAYRAFYSCVSKQAQDGWEDFLNILLTDENTSLLLQDVAIKECFMSVSQESSEKGLAYFFPMWDVELEEDFDTFYERCYAEAQDLTSNFIFNPAPVEEELKECEALSFKLTDYEIRNKDGNKDIEKIKEAWNYYIEGMEDSPIQLVLEEVNRQYKEWTKE